MFKKVVINGLRKEYLRITLLVEASPKIKTKSAKDVNEAERDNKN